MIDNNVLAVAMVLLAGVVGFIIRMAIKKTNNYPNNITKAIPGIADKVTVIKSDTVWIKDRLVNVNETNAKIAQSLDLNKDIVKRLEDMNISNVQANAFLKSIDGTLKQMLKNSS